MEVDDGITHGCWLAYLLTFVNGNFSNEFKKTEHFQTAFNDLARSVASRFVFGIVWHILPLMLLMEEEAAVSCCYAPSPNDLCGS